MRATATAAIVLRNAMTAAVTFILAAGVACQPECPNGSKWSPDVDRDDLRACQGARGGEAWSADARFYDCMLSMGYRRVCQ